MILNVHPHVNPKLTALLRELGPVWRKNLLGVGANGLKVCLRRYLRNEAQRRHTTALMLGGTPTGHIQKGAARIAVWDHDDTHASVIVPIAGIQRAFGDLTITAKKATALTIPVSGAAYGHRVRELRRMGWSVFRPKGHDYLMGSHDGEAAQLLYVLRKKVIVRRDRTLLPTDDVIADSINRPTVHAVKAALERSAG